MKKILLVCLTVIFVQSFSGQIRIADSLISILDAGTLTKKEQLLVYDSICNIYDIAYSKNLKTYADKGLELAEKEKNEIMISKFIEYIGIDYKIKKNYDTALIFFDKALALAIKSKDNEREASIYLNMGMAHSMKESKNVAMEHYMKALPLCENINKKLYARVLANIGAIHRTSRNSKMAIQYLEQAYTVAEQQNDIPAMMKSCHELAAFFLEVGENDMSLENGLKALNYSRAINNEYIEAMASHALALIYIHGFQDFDNSINMPLNLYNMPKIREIKRFMVLR